MNATKISTIHIIILFALSLFLAACTDVRPLPGHTNIFDPAYKASAASGDLWTATLASSKLSTGGNWYTFDDSLMGGTSTLVPATFSNASTDFMPEVITQCGGNSLCLAITFGTDSQFPYGGVGFSFLSSSGVYDISAKNLCVAYQTNLELRIYFIATDSLEALTKEDPPGWTLPTSNTCTVSSAKLDSLTTIIHNQIAPADYFQSTTGVRIKFLGSQELGGLSYQMKIYSVGFGNSCTCP